MSTSIHEGSKQDLGKTVTTKLGDRQVYSHKATVHLHIQCSGNNHSPTSVNATQLWVRIMGVCVLECGLFHLAVTSKGKYIWARKMAQLLKARLITKTQTNQTK